MADDFPIGLSIPPEYQQSTSIAYPPFSVQDTSTPWMQTEGESPFLKNGRIGSSVDMNATHARAWYGRFALDLFRVGGEDVVGAVLSSRDSLYKLNIPYFDLELDGALAGFDVFPETGDFKKRNLLGLAASVNLFLGSEQKLGSFIFREMAETSGQAYFGKNFSPVLHVPIDAGLSAGVKAGRSLFSLFAIAESYLTVGDVQDVGSIVPFLNKVDAGLSAKTQKLDFELGMEFFQYGAKFIYGDLDVPYSPSWLPGTLYIILGARYPVEGGTPDNWVHEKGNIYGGLGYDWGKSDDEGTNYGVSARVYLASDKKVFTSGDTGIGEPVSPFDLLGSPQVGNKVGCELNMSAGSASCAVNGKKYNICYADYPAGDSIKCYSQGKDELVATFEAKGTIKKPLSGNGLYYVYEISQVTYNNETISILKEQTDLDSLIKYVNGKNLGYPQKLELLRQLATMAYDTYDRQALVVPNGVGNTNSASYEDIYKESRNTFFEQDHGPTTVCRGFAKYITYVASQIGFEAHSVSVQTRSVGHVFTVLREKGTGNDYYVLNYGNDPLVFVSARNIDEVIREYCKQKGYPPQLVNWVFGPDGSPETVIETPLFRSLESAATPRQRGEDHLKGR